MAPYVANADFQRDYYKLRKLAEQSPGNDDEISIICFPHKLNTVLESSKGLSLNEARILYTIEKRLYLQSKGAHFGKIRRHA